MIYATLHEDLNLSKKSARWVPEVMMNERVRTCEAFLAMVCCHYMAMLGQIVTTDKSAVAFHTPHTKQQSKQWLGKKAKM
jgi:hypothetical protein